MELSGRDVINRLIDEGVHPQVFLDVLVTRGKLTTWQAPTWRCYRVRTDVENYRVDL
jgi:hypothetical protein